MGKCSTSRPCPVCNTLMGYEYDTIDGWLETYSCYTCPRCNYNDGSETGACWIEADGRRFEWAYDKPAPRGIKAAMKRHKSAFVKAAHDEPFTVVDERMEY